MTTARFQWHLLQYRCYPKAEAFHLPKPTANLDPKQAEKLFLDYEECGSVKRGEESRDPTFSPLVSDITKGKEQNGEVHGNGP